MWSLFRRPTSPSPSLADEFLAKSHTSSQTAPLPVPSSAQNIPLAALIQVYSQSIETLRGISQKSQDSAQARKQLDALLTRLPFQISPELYTQMATEPFPIFQPLYRVLATLPAAEITLNFHFLFHYYLEEVLRNSERTQVQAALKKLYLELKTSVTPEILISFLDLVPAGYLDDERGSLMGRDELIKVLDQLRAEKDKVEAAKIRDDALLDSIGDGVVAVNSDKKVIFSNHSAQQMLRLSEAELQDSAWFEIAFLVNDAGEKIEVTQNPLHLALEKQEKISDSTYSFSLKDIGTLPVALTATPFILSGQLAGAILVFKDITHERQVDRQKT